MTDRAPYEREHGIVQRLYGLPMVPAGRGYRAAVGRFLVLGIVVAVLFSGGLVLLSFLVDRL